LDDPPEEPTTGFASRVPFASFANPRAAQENHELRTDLFLEGNFQTAKEETLRDLCKDPRRPRIFGPSSKEASKRCHFDKQDLGADK
jgi:hypothetical protein